MAIRREAIELNNPVPVLYQNLFGGETFFDSKNNEEVPRVLWAENVMPTKEGLASVSQISYITAEAAGYDLNFYPHRGHLVYDADRNASYYLHTSGGHRVYDTSTSTWIAPTELSGGDENPVSTAYINGVSYVFQVTTGLHSFASGFATAPLETVSGVTATNMKGICSALDYLIFWDDTTIYWSAPGSPLEHSPLSGTVTTGAGSTIPQDLKGTIIVCYPIADGFLIYSRENIVSARYSGNSRNPWVFREVENGFGIQRMDRVGAYQNSKSHFVWTIAGLQEVDINRAISIFPEVSDFLGGSKYYSSDYDGTFTEVLSTELLGDGSPRQLEVKPTLVGTRYLCLSYGTRKGYFKFILVFDILLKQWGHIKITHIDVMDFVDIESGDYSGFDYQGISGPGYLAIVNGDGTITAIRIIPENDSISGTVIDETGEVILGEIALSRNNLCQLNKVTVHGRKESGFTVNVLTTDSHGQRAAEEAFVEYTAVNTKEYYGSVSGVSHRVRLRGNFNLTSVTLDLVQLGRL